MKLNDSHFDFSVQSIKHITLISMLTSLTVVGRLMFTFIPNVQPVTVLVIIITLVMGVQYGVIISVLSIVISNLILGIGLWTFPQIIGYLVITLLTGFVIKPSFDRISHTILSIYAFFMGLLYGFIVSICYSPIYGAENFFMYYMAGILFDIYHAIGNLVFYFILAPVFIPLLHRLLTKYYKKEKWVRGIDKL